MNNDEIVHFLDKLASRVPVGPAPIGMLVRQGRAVRHRRRAAFGVSIMLVTCVGIAGAVAAARELPGGNSSVPIVGSAAPGAPDGRRLVGYGGLTVAVPDEWSTNDTRCGAPLSDTVYFQTDGRRGCLVRVDGNVDSLAITTTSSLLGQAILERATISSEINGIVVKQTAITYDDSTSQLAQSIVAHDQQAIFTISVTDRETLQAVHDSLTLVPEGYTSVPFNLPSTSNPSAVVERASLKATIVEEPRPTLSAGTLASVEPDSGSVLPIGGDVTLMVVPGKPSPKE